MDLNKRLERLEQENRVMKRTGLAAFVLVLSTLLVGAATPESIPDVVEAREFRVIGENGEIRVGLSRDGIIYFDKNSTPRIVLHADGILYRDKESKHRARMSRDGILYFDENGMPRVVLHSNGLLYFDENKKPRAVVGKITSDPSAVALLDEAGVTIWRAPE